MLWNVDLLRATETDSSRHMLPPMDILMWTACPVSNLVHSIQKRMAYPFNDAGMRDGAGV